MNKIVSDVKSIVSSTIKLFTNPVVASESIAATGKKAADQLKTVINNPVSSAKSTVNTTKNAVNNFVNSTDEEQGKTLGNIAGGIITFAATKKVAGEDNLYFWDHDYAHDQGDEISPTLGTSSTISRYS